MKIKFSTQRADCIEHKSGQPDALRERGNYCSHRDVASELRVLLGDSIWGQEAFAPTHAPVVIAPGGTETCDSARCWSRIESCLTSESPPPWSPCSWSSVNGCRRETLTRTP